MQLFPVRLSCVGFSPTPTERRKIVVRTSSGTEGLPSARLPTDRVDGRGKYRHVDCVHMQSPYCDF